MTIYTDMTAHRLADETIGMFLEYRDVHGRTEEQARAEAALEVAQGVDAEAELRAAGELGPLPDDGILTVALDRASRTALLSGNFPGGSQVLKLGDTAVYERDGLAVRLQLSYDPAKDPAAIQRALLSADTPEGSQS